MIRSIIKDSSKLRQALKDRWKKMKQEDVADDALRFGQPGINRQGINKYLNKPYSAGALNDEQIIWLALRWGIPLRLEIGLPEKQVKYLVPEKFEEKESLKLTKEIFPNTILHDT